jgi:hypothetical protein
MAALVNSHTAIDWIRNARRWLARRLYPGLLDEQVVLYERIRQLERDLRVCESARRHYINRSRKEGF